MRGRSWHAAAAVALLALLAIVAALQYRWLGDVSRAERERLQGSLTSRASEFGDDLDGDLTRAFAAFQLDNAQFNADPYGAISTAAERAARDTRTGTAVRAVYVAQPGDAGAVRRFDIPGRALVDAEWPSELAPLGQRIARAPESAVVGLPVPPGFLGDLLDGNVPALVVPITAFELPAPSPSGELVMRVAPAQGHWRALVVWLDRERLRSQLVAPLVAKHFGEPSTSEFNVSVVSSATGQSLYRSGPGDVRAATADLAADVFALRLTDLHWRRSLPPGTAPGAIPKLLQDRFSITIVRRGAGESADPLSKAGLVGGAEWKLLVRARAGSLDAVVARSRARNLTLSLGVLGILACSLGLILVASAREQRTARQQLEFVAAVSHELRTPLAVIRSAGENLADGVVSGDQIARYGTLISSEGRRLSEMVERVMDFAGIASGTVFRSTRPVDSNAVIDAVVKSLRDESADRSIGFRVRVPSGLPPLLADPDALQSAIQNVVGNAVKYSQPGGEVEIDATATAQTAAIVVRDRGIGIDAADMPHVFEPFYRGRRALDAQIRGSGVGLSVVRKMVEVHGGRVNVTQREGGGTVVTIEWPVAPRDEEAHA